MSKRIPKKYQLEIIPTKNHKSRRLTMKDMEIVVRRKKGFGFA